jgi:hypothetical protein
LIGKVANPETAVVDAPGAGVAVIVGTAVVEADVGGEAVVGLTETGGVIGVTVATFFFATLPPVAAATTSKTMTARTTHETICVPAANLGNASTDLVALTAAPS